MSEIAAEGIGGKLDFLGHFSGLADPRQSKKVLYPLDEVLLLTLCAVLCEKYRDTAKNTGTQYRFFKSDTPSKLPGHVTKIDNHRQ